MGFIERRADKLVFVLILAYRCARQDPAFRGVTGVVVKITHEITAEGYKPTGFSVPEVLGTISERGVYYDSVLIKGGTHEHQ